MPWSTANTSSWAAFPTPENTIRDGGMPAASARLTNFVEKAARATLVGDVFDDAATGQGLLNYFLRGVQSGAIGEDEAVRRSGLTVEEIRGRSFVAIVKARARG